MFKRLIVWVMTQALILAQTAAIAQTSHDQGVAAGRAANTIRGMVNQPSATGVVPGTPPRLPKPLWPDAQPSGPM